MTNEEFEDTLNNINVVDRLTANSDFRFIIARRLRKLDNKEEKSLSLPLVCLDDLGAMSDLEGFESEVNHVQKLIYEVIISKEDKSYRIVIDFETGKCNIKLNNS